MSQSSPPASPPDTGVVVVIAEFGIAPAHRDAFLLAARDDGDGSVNNEPGCHQFDVLARPDEPGAVLLLEVYADKAAFEAHLRTPHYARFAEAVSRLGATRTRVRFLSRMHQGGAA